MSDPTRSAFAANVSENASRVAEQGSWPGYIDPQRSLTERVPSEDGTAPGFDAGIACTLDLIPRASQRLSSILHAAYTEEAVEQVRSEVEAMDPDSETTWWLAACSVCEESGVDAQGFEDQVAAFLLLAEDPEARVAAARQAFEAMLESFTIVNGVAFVTRDGGAQGAYVQGYDLAVSWAEAYGIFFVSTFRPTLGLEDFSWSDRLDDQDRPMSGPVHGSRQFVKASCVVELGQATAIARRTLGIDES